MFLFIGGQALLQILFAYHEEVLLSGAVSSRNWVVAYTSSFRMGVACVMFVLRRLAKKLLNQDRTLYLIGASGNCKAGGDCACAHYLVPRQDCAFPAKLIMQQRQVRNTDSLQTIADLMRGR